MKSPLAVKFSASLEVQDSKNSIWHYILEQDNIASWFPCFKADIFLVVEMYHSLCPCWKQIPQQMDLLLWLVRMYSTS